MFSGGQFSSSEGEKWGNGKYLQKGKKATLLLKTTRKKFFVLKNMSEMTWKTKNNGYTEPF